MKRPLVVDYALTGDLKVLNQDTSYPTFFADSRCLGIEDEDIFFSEDLVEIGKAKAVCSDCPIQTSCLTWALREEVEGVFGGTTAEERAELGFIMPAGSAEISLMREQYKMICDVPVAIGIDYFGVNERTIFRWRAILLGVKVAS